MDANLTEQLGAVPPCDAHEFLLTTRMIWNVWRNVVYLAVDGRPGVLFLVVHLKHGRRDTQQRVYTLVSIRNARQDGSCKGRGGRRDVLSDLVQTT